MARPNSDISSGISSHNNGESRYNQGLKKLRVPEAAQVLGISPEAVRNRLSRGKLQGSKEGNTIFVLLDPDISEDRSHDISGSNEDRSHDISRATEALLAAKDETIQALREQLEAEREAAQRKDTIIMTMAQRIPELEAPSEPREAPETVSEDTGRGQTRGGDTGEPRASWWRRWFGIE